MTDRSDENIILQEVEKYYSNRNDPYKLSDLGKAIRQQKVDLPSGIPLKRFLKYKLGDKIEIIEDPYVPARVAVALPKNKEEMLTQLIGSKSKASDIDEVDYSRIPFALTAAFCSPVEQGKRLFFRKTPPFRYVVEASPPDDTWIEIDDEFRLQSVIGADVRKLSADDRSAIHQQFSKWARAHSIDLRSIYVGSSQTQTAPSSHKATPKNALQRLVDAQEPALQKKIRIPLDIAQLLMRST